jgi:collagen type VI alpha
LTYSYHVYPAFNLSTFNSVTSLRRGIQRAKYAGQGTFTAQAIEYTREVMFSNESGGRQNVPEIMIIITDGISENQTATTSEAKTAKLKGIKIIVVGIGNGVDKTELQTISSDPSSKFMINVNSYGKLDTIMDMLAGKACTGILFYIYHTYIWYIRTRTVELSEHFAFIFGYLYSIL